MFGGKQKYNVSCSSSWLFLSGTTTNWQDWFNLIQKNLYFSLCFYFAWNQLSIWSGKRFSTSRLISQKWQLFPAKTLKSERTSQRRDSPSLSMRILYIYSFVCVSVFVLTEDVALALFQCIKTFESQRNSSAVDKDSQMIWELLENWDEKWWEASC